MVIFPFRIYIFRLLIRLIQFLLLVHFYVTVRLLVQYVNLDALLRRVISGLK